MDQTALDLARTNLLAHTGPVRLAWRHTYLDYQPGISLVCDSPDHPGVPDMDIARDNQGIYDCCPPVHIEVPDDAAGKYLVAALNTLSVPATPEPPADEAALRARIAATVEQPLPCTVCGLRQYDYCGTAAGAPPWAERITAVVWAEVGPYLAARTTQES